MSRAKKPKRLFGEERLDVPTEQKRFSTPVEVAEYRAKRLSCDVLVDLCSGYGFQSFAFAAHCKRVIGIELDEEKVRYAKKYAEKLGITNVTFICGDVLDPAVFEQLRELTSDRVDVVFCDPERLAAEKHRSLDTIQPDIRKLVSMYSKFTQNIVIEFPPHIQDLPFDAEFEYLVLHGAMNRLTLYFGDLKQAAKSLVMLPKGNRIVSDSREREEITEVKSVAGYRYLLEANPGVVLSELFTQALVCEAQDHGFVTDCALLKQGKKVFVLSNTHVSSPFFTAYEILEAVSYTPGEDKKDLLTALQKHHAGHVLVRYSIAPDKYWDERRSIEKALSGDKTICVFHFDKTVLAQRL